MDSGMDARLVNIETSVAHIKGDVADIKTDIGIMRGDINTMRGDIGIMRGDIGIMRGELTTLTGQVGALISRVDIFIEQGAATHADVTTLNGRLDALNANALDRIEKLNRLPTKRWLAALFVIFVLILAAIFTVLPIFV